MINDPFYVIALCAAYSAQLRAHNSGTLLGYYPLLINQYCNFLNFLNYIVIVIVLIQVTRLPCVIGLYSHTA
jgi:hypothetical protein